MSRRRSLRLKANVGGEAVEDIEGRGCGAAKRRMALMILKNFWLGGFLRQTDSQARDTI
ncbi:hypothetical protein DY000_02020399 [Brassica cretica]|uniref:Uncharacterized protein n=1 Tax=Brassica cretica TaxID=69181 RepID=A0ABQ7E382_BRACR|nr:hypothetical protein DY000_02020399 [Brassica cretica]